MRQRLLVLALVVGSLGCRMSDNQAFVWTGDVSDGTRLQVRNLTGPITVHASPDAQIHVHGTRRWRSGFPERVNFIVRRQGSDVTVCALWGSRGRCDAEAYRSRPGLWDRLLRRKVTVDLVVSVPTGVFVDARTTNGDVEVRGVGSAVKAVTVNGDVDVATRFGPVSASTVNGDVDAEVASLEGSERIDLHTVNGDVTARIPDQPDATIELQTVNGSLTSDFPVVMTPASSRKHTKHLTATLGAGGPRLELSTVNGDAELRRARPRT
jgi:hypothetical protein